MTLPPRGNVENVGLAVEKIGDNAFGTSRKSWAWTELLWSTLRLKEFSSLPLRVASRNHEQPKVKLLGTTIRITSFENLPKSYFPRHPGVSNMD